MLVTNGASREEECALHFRFWILILNTCLLVKSKFNLENNNNTIVSVMAIQDCEDGNRLPHKE